MTQTVLYARCSTTDQTIDHQETDARRAGFALDHVVQDHGVSGINTNLSDRPGGKRLFDMLRRGDVLVVRWVDRLGRNYADVTDSLREFMRRGVVVRTLISGMVFDGATTDPIQMAVRDALIGFMAATAQAQAEATKEAQRAGIAYAKGQEDRTAYRGRRPTFDRGQLEMVDQMLAAGARVTDIAEATGLNRQTVYRIRDNRAEAEASLVKWEPAARRA